MANLPVETYDVVNIDAIAATIRKMESGGDYANLGHGTGGASGAYQFEPQTWQGLSKQFASQVPQASMYSYAAAAPADIQDKIAKLYISQILTQNNNNVAAVPAVWYVGSVQAAENQWNTTPAGNKITVGDYVHKWLDAFHGISGQNPGSTSVVDAVTGAVTNLPGEVTQAASGAWSAITAPLDFAKYIWGVITNMNNWKHILEVIGGAILVLIGLWILASSMGLAPNPTRAIRSAVF